MYSRIDICIRFFATVCTALLFGGSRDRYPVVSLGIFSVATDGTMCPGVDSASKNEYQENSWGKDGRRVSTEVEYGAADFAVRVFAGGWLGARLYASRFFDSLSHPWKCRTVTHSHNRFLAYCNEKALLNRSRNNHDHRPVRRYVAHK
jgi:hypothetical protein